MSRMKLPNQNPGLAPVASATPSTAAAGVITQHDMLAIVRQVHVEDHFERWVLQRAGKIAARAPQWHGQPTWYAEHAGCVALEWSCREGGQGEFLPRVHFASSGERVAIEMLCTCGQEHCEHAAALILRVQRHYDWPKAIDPVERWLNDLQRIPAAPKASQKSASPRVAFVLGVEANASRLGSLKAAVAELVDDARSGSLRKRPLAYTGVDWQDSAIEHGGLVARLRMMPRLERTNGFRWHRLEGLNGQSLLESMLESGASFLEASMRPLARGEVVAPQWSWEPAPNGTQRLSWSLPVEGARRLIVEEAWYLDPRHEKIGRVGVPARLLQAIEQMPSIPHVRARLLRASWPPNELLAAVPPPLDVPDAERVHAPMRPVIVLHAALCKPFAASDTGVEAPGAFLYLMAYADYRGRRIALGGRRHAGTLAQREGERTLELVRDFNAEDRARTVLEAKSIRAAATAAPKAVPLLDEPLPGEALAHRQYHHSSMLKPLHRVLQHLALEGFAIERDEALPFAIAAHPDALVTRFEETPGNGMFNFDVGVELDGEYVNLLPLIMDALQRRELDWPASASDAGATWLVEAAGGRWVELPAARVREAIAPVLDWLDVESGMRHASLRLTRLQAAVVAAKLPAHATQGEPLSIDELREVVRQLGEANNAPLPDTPAGFRGVLRVYQREGLRWLGALQAHRLGGILADDMGLGKTVQVLAHLQAEKNAGWLERPALIVVPKGLLFNWLDEAAHFTPQLKILTLHGPQRHRGFADIAGADIVLTTYSLVSLDLEHLRAQSYALLVIDESQWVKNPDTRAARALTEIQADTRVSLTGTPLENHLGELWAQFNLVLPGYLGERRRFNRAFRTPIERREDDYKRAALRLRVAPFLLRRNKDQVAPELPTKTETTLYVEMDGPQRALYDALRLAQHETVREAIAQQGVERSGIAVLSALLKLREACCDPRLVNLAGTHQVESSCKLDALTELTESLVGAGRRMLIFSQFTRMLALIAAHFDARGLVYAVLTGESADRREPVERFQSGAVPILLASLKAGGVGLNLTAADTVVHYDPWWNPAAENQATDRAHRIGQDKPVFVYRLVCKNSVEEKIEALKQRKSDLVRGVLEGEIPATLRLDAENIDLLLGS
jgi:superfamily II DNA or RNA helicase